MGRVICFDIETTGFDWAHGDRCIDIGAVEVIDGKITDNTFHEYINPDGKIITHENYMVHKLSNAFLEDKPKISVVAPKFLEYIGDSPVVAHNGIDFDFPFLNYELKKLGLPEIPRSRQLDTLNIARNRVFGLKVYTLDALAKFYGISLASRADAHGALIDSELLARVYIELENTEPAPDVSEIIEKQHAAFLSHPKIGTDFPRRDFPVSDEELEIHNAFMEKLTGAKK